MRTFFSVLVVVFSIGAYLNAEEVVDDFSQTESTKVKISGTASGGEVALVFAEKTYPNSSTPTGFSTYPTEVRVQTLAGESSSTIAARLSARFAELAKNDFISSVKGSDIIFLYFAAGEIGLVSTDIGIKSYLGLQNVVAVKTPENFVKISWDVPQNVAFDSIYVYRGHVLVSIVTGQPLNSAIDKTAKGNDFPTEDSSSSKVSLDYRIIAVKDGVPSAPSTVSIQNPTANP